MLALLSTTHLPSPILQCQPEMLRDVSYILFIKYNITFKQIWEGERNLLVTWERLSTMDRQTKCLK